MEKVKKMKDSCAPMALLYASGKDQETVIRVCKLHGFKEKGMTDVQWKKAAVDLGIEFTGGTIKECTLKKFIVDHPQGLYLLGTCDHLFCVDAGLIVDPKNDLMPGLNRRIKQAWRVKN